MDAGFFTPEFLEPPCTLPGGQQLANAGFELAKRADNLEEENKGLKTQVLSKETVSLKEEIEKLRGEITESHRINVLLSTERKKLVEDYLGLRKKNEEVAFQQDKLAAESSGAASQHPKKLWATVENFKQLAEFENALSTTVERFKESPKFLDGLGANAAYGVCSFVRKYKEYSNLRYDYIEFQEGYNPSWFAEVSLDAASDDEEDENEALLLVELPLRT
ncbi:hypothetical protein LIER_05110 [Lithospermum erythrorhizon]|uniref:Uncharacterized protein n=1 Tax=Lithospermum erythrorhizon TaxID=34254 RepID=A0AAV3P405_LITER